MQSAKTSDAAAAAQDTITLVNQGSYGCIYRPSLSCAQGRLRVAGSNGSGGYLSKLQRAGRAANTEIAIGAKFNAPKFRKYMSRFAPVISSCPIARSQIPEDEPAFKKCDALHPRKKNKKRQQRQKEEEEEEEEEAPLVLMKMKVAGDITLIDYLDTRIDRDTATTASTAAGPRVMTAKTSEHLEYLWKDLCVSLAQLAKMQVVHYDLKGNNIMYQTDRHMPVIIDFGLSLDMAKLLSSDDVDVWRAAFYTYKPDYAPWCPETVLCSALFHKLPESSSSSDVVGADELHGVIEECFKLHPTLLAVGKRRPADMARKRARLADDVTALKGLSRMEAAKQLLRSTWRQWDKFALAGFFLRYRVSGDAVPPFWDEVDEGALA